MGLHSIFESDVQWVWRFYDAVNRRPGRSHLLKVPSVLQTEFHIPVWYTSDRSRANWLERMTAEPKWGAPYSISQANPIYDRYCDTRQEARHWNKTVGWRRFRDWQMPKRGVCRTCHEFAMTLPETKTMGANLENPDSGTVGEIRNNTEWTEWLRFAKGYRDTTT